jgi:hypothetical protein
MNRRQSPRAIDAPEECHVRLRTERHGGYLPARIFTRLGLLTAEIDGAQASVESVWTSGETITKAQYDDLVRDRKRAKPF